MTYKKQQKELTTKLDLGNKDKIKIIKFDGTNLRCAEFLSNFRFYSKTAGWSEPVKAMKLLWCLTGPDFSFAQQLGETVDDQTSYEYSK